MYHPSLAGSQVVLQAAWFAARKHSAQRRKGTSADPYLNHLIEVACLIAQALPEPDPNLLAAALLHDAIEDVGVTHAEIAELFTQDVADLVAEVTDDKSLPKHERKRLQVENAPHKSKRAGMIKIADKISNLRSILADPPVEWDYDRKRQYFDWAHRVVNAIREPNPILMAEFEATYRRFK